VVKWSKPAKLDLKQIHGYISRDSRFYAEKVSFFPEAGRIVPEIGDSNIREVFVYSYRLIYEIFPNGIEILALIHGKREFSKDLINTQ
jgi:toxin ParE1/3/4